jgi:hypothetical protein
MSEKEKLQKTLENAHRVLSILEEQVSGFGSLAVPPEKLIQLEDKRREVTELQKKLEKLAQPVRISMSEVSEPSEGSVSLVSPSPFIVAGRLENVENFVGRSRERTTLVERSFKGASTSLVGDRRIGKTWLLDYLRLVAPTELGSRHRVAYIDASRDSCRSVSGFVLTCLAELNIKIDSPDPTNLRLDTLENVVRELRSRNQIPILCLDQFERFGKVNLDEFDLNFFEGLRAIAGLGTVLLTASKSPLIELVSQIGNTSPFFNIFETVRVKMFSSREAQQFVEKQANRVGFNEQEKVKLLELGQSHPLRLQLVGEMLYLDKRLSQEEDPDLYRPEDPEYWLDFGERLEDKFRGMVRV